MELSVSSIIELIVGIILMMTGIFRFTIYREKFNKSFNLAGFTIAPEAVSVTLFIIGLVMVLLFLVNNLQPLFYGNRIKHPGITYIIHRIISAKA